MIVPSWIPISRLVAAPVFLLLAASGARAELVPGFDLQFAAEHATDVIVLDYDGTVLENWRGNVEPGVKLPFPANIEPVTVLYPFRDEMNPNVAQVTGARRVMFLKRLSGQDRWEPVGFHSKEPRLATVWIEKEQCFAVYQFVNPGAGAQMHPLYIDEGRLKATVQRKPDEGLAANVAAPRALPDLAGAWRIFLPAGFEHEVELVKETNEQLTLQPVNLNFGGEYEQQQGRLVSVAANERSEHYVWEIRSPYMLTLIEQPSGTGASYLGAVLFRPREVPLEN